MAKGSERYLLGGSIKFLYVEQSDMPWPEIEEAAGKTFSKTERGEILTCTYAFSHERSWHEAGAPKEHVVDLRRRIIKHAEALNELCESCCSLSAVRGETPDHQALRTLTIISGRAGFNLLEELNRAGLSAQRLLSGLSGDSASTPEKTARTGEVAALAAFIAKALDGIQLDEVKEARGARPWDDARRASAKEYQRWGIPIGPKSNRFRRFAGAVLKRKISPDQLVHAFKEGRWRAIGQYEDAYDRAMDEGK